MSLRGEPIVTIIQIEKVVLVIEIIPSVFLLCVLILIAIGPSGLGLFPFQLGRGTTPGCGGLFRLLSVHLLFYL
jgi:hypothetical protein